MQVLSPSDDTLERMFAPFLRNDRVLLVLAQGSTAIERLEPFATLVEVLQGAEELLPVVATEGWPATSWEYACKSLLDTVGATPEQGRRALEQRVDDGRLEVLFLERGRVVGGALTLVAHRRPDGLVPLNTKIAVLELLQAARDALTLSSRTMGALVRDAREALGVPAGAMTTVAEVRRHRPADPLRPRDTQDIGQTIAQASRVRGSVGSRPISTPAPKPPQPPSPEERHRVVQGTCSLCGRTGRALEGPCGRPELGRFGMLELD